MENETETLEKEEVRNIENKNDKEINQNEIKNNVSANGMSKDIKTEDILSEEKLKTENNTKVNDNFVKTETNSEFISDKKTDIISEYFNSESDLNFKNKLRDIAKVFGQSENELSKEFRAYKAKKLFKKMNYALLSTDKSNENYVKDCLEAEKYGFSSVTVLPNMVGTAKNTLKGKEIEVRAFISYPFGEEISKVKYYAVKKAIQSGCDSIAVAVSTSMLKNRDYRLVAKELKKIVKIARKHKVSALIDGTNLSSVELEKTCRIISKEAGVYSIIPTHFIKREKPDLQQIREIFRAVDGKCYVECGGEIEKATEAVSALDAGANLVCSPLSPKVADDLEKQIAD